MVEFTTGEGVYVAGKYKCDKCGNVQFFDKLEDFERCLKCKKDTRWTMVEEV